MSASSSPAETSASAIAGDIVDDGRGVAAAAAGESGSASSGQSMTDSTTTSFAMSPSTSSSRNTFVDGNIRSFLSLGDSTTASSSSPTRPTAEGTTISSPTSPNSPQYAAGRSSSSSSPTFLADTGMSPSRTSSRVGVMHRVQDDMDMDAAIAPRVSRGSGGPKSRGSRLGAQMMTSPALRPSTQSPSFGAVREEPAATRESNSKALLSSVSGKGKAREDGFPDDSERSDAPAAAAASASRNRSGSLGRVAAMAAKLVGESVSQGRDDRAPPARNFSISRGPGPSLPMSVQSSASSATDSSPFTSASSSLPTSSASSTTPITQQSSAGPAESFRPSRQSPHRQSNSSASGGAGEDWGFRSSASSRQTTFDSSKAGTSEYSSAMTSDSVPVSPTRSLLLGRESATPSSLSSVAESSSSSSQTGAGGPPRVGRLGRLQYNKADDISVAGPPDRGWEPVIRTASSSGSYGSRGPGYRRSELMQGGATRQGSNDSNAESGSLADRGTPNGFRGSSPAALRKSANDDEEGEWDHSRPSEHAGDRSDASLSYRSAGSQGPGQRELLLPALSGVRSVVADVVGQTSLYDPKAGIAEMPSEASSEAYGAYNGSDNKSRPPPANRSSSRLDSRRTSGSTDTRVRNLVSSPEPTAAVRLGSKHTRDSPSLGSLSDVAIAQLGALPGVDPKSLLNKDNAPLSSKNVLTIALQKAQSAVQLDSSNSVPEAILAYQQAVRLLKEVMERIAPRQGKRNKASREEERRRLKNIHDTYSDRIRLLSMIYTTDDPDYESVSQDLSQSSGGGYESVTAPFEDQSWSDYRSEGSSYDNTPLPSIDSAAIANGMSSPPSTKDVLGHSDYGLAVTLARTPSPDGAVHPSNPALRTPRDSFEARNGERRDSAHIYDGGLGGVTKELAAPEISIEQPPPPAPVIAIERTASSRVSDPQGGDDTPLTKARSNALGEVSSSGIKGRNSMEQQSVYAKGLHPGESERRPISREDDLRTPTTPFFDAVPSLGNEEEPHDARHQSATPTQPRSPRSPHSRNGGGSSLPILPNAPALGLRSPSMGLPHRRSSSASSIHTTPRTSRDAPPAAEEIGQADKVEHAPPVKIPAKIISGVEASPTYLVSPTTTTGTISQRRKGNGPPSPLPEFSFGTQGDEGEAERLPFESDRVDASDAGFGAYEQARFAGTIRGDAYDATTRKARPKARESGTAKGRSGSMDLLRSQLDRDQNIADQQQNGSVGTGSPLPSPTTGSSSGRQRALSQPAFRRPQIPGAFIAANPPPAMPPRMSRKVSMPSSTGPPSLAGLPSGLRVMASNNLAQQASMQLQSQAQYGAGGHYRFPPSPSPSSINPFDASPTSATAPGGMSHTASILSDIFPTGLPSLVNGTPSFASTARSAFLPSAGITTPLPDRGTLAPLPSNGALRPFYMMRQLHASMNKGAYLTPRLYFSRSLWVPHGVKLPSLETKCRVLDLLVSAVETVERSGVPLLLPPSPQAGLWASQAAAFVKQLEELDILFVDVQNTLAKKLAFLETAPGKKNNSSFGSISSKFARSLGSGGGGKNSRNIDASPAGYFEGLGRVFVKAQALEAHLLSATRYLDRSGSATVDTYAIMPVELRQNIEAKLRRSSDFFATVILTFVLKDMSILLDRYLKRSTALGE